MAAVVSLLGGSATIVRAQAGVVILAIDSGAHLQPIAQIGREGWVAVPTAGLGRLAPRDWTRWTADGHSTPARLSVREPIGRCTAPGRMPVVDPIVPGEGADYVGVAASGPVEIARTRRLDRAHAQWANITSAAEALFERREREHGVSPSAFAKVSLTLDRVYEGGDGRGSTAYYFEASKRLFDAGNTPAEDPQGVVRVTVSGWLRDSGGRLVTAGSKGELHWDPVDEPRRVPASGLTPLAVLRHEGEQVWIMHERVGVRERFAVYALGTTVREIVRRDAAAC